MKKTLVNLHDYSYPIYRDHKCCEHLPGWAKKLAWGNYGLIVTSKKIYTLFKRKIHTCFPKNAYAIVTLPDGEQAKQLRWAIAVINALLRIDTFGNKIFLTALGGGTIGDVTGFAAAMYKRGIPYIQIPTTLLAQIDSSIGGKTAVDLPQAKNILGAYHQPSLVCIDTSFLNTLPRAHMKDGLAEGIKYGALIGGAFFTFLENNRDAIFARHSRAINHFIDTCTALKADIVSKDQKEARGIRTLLNFGHTFGHALETSLGYRAISHGQAIAIGMVFAALVSCNRRCCTPNEKDRLIALIKHYGLIKKCSFKYPLIMKSLYYDKKFTQGRIRMVLLEKIGKLIVVDAIRPTELEKAFALLPHVLYEQ